MKSLEKVKENKIRLVDVKNPESNEPGSNSISEVFTQHLKNGTKPIYLVKNLNNKNIIELLQQITLRNPVSAIHFSTYEELEK